MNQPASPNRSADEFELAELQSLLYRLVTAPAGVEEALSHERALQDFGLETVIAGTKRLSARDRVGIYANAYFYRLLDIFKEDFSCTYTVLGDINFHNLITGYLIEYPPSEPSVFWAGHHLPRYLETIRGPAAVPVLQLPFLADLARLERACIEVFQVLMLKLWSKRRFAISRPTRGRCLGSGYIRPRRFSILSGGSMR